MIIVLKSENALIVGKYMLEVSLVSLCKDGGAVVWCVIMEEL